MKPIMRHKARFHAVQALYQALYTNEEIAELLAQHLIEMQSNKVDTEYFQTLVKGVLTDSEQLDQTFKPFLSRAISELTPVELCVLRLATYELLYSLDVPYKVVINEALELNKAFGTDEGFKFVNGVLDKVAKKIRAAEINA